MGFSKQLMSLNFFSDNDTLRGLIWLEVKVIFDSSPSEFSCEIQQSTWREGFGTGYTSNYATVNYTKYKYSMPCVCFRYFLAAGLSLG